MGFASASCSWSACSCGVLQAAVCDLPASFVQSAQSLSVVQICKSATVVLELNSISVIEPQEAHGFKPRTSIARHSVTSVTSTLNMGINRKLFENSRQHMWFKFGLGVLICKIITSEGVGTREQSKLPCFLAISSKIRRSNKKHATPRNGRVAPPLP